MTRQTELALRTRLDRPFHFDREGPSHIQQFHHMKSGHIYTNLWQVELEISEKLQKLKMECFGDGLMNAETQSSLSNCVYKEEKPVRMYYQAIEEKSNYFEIPKSSEAFRKLWQEELEIIEKLHKLKLNLVKFDQKKKCISTYRETADTLLNPTYTQAPYPWSKTNIRAHYTRLNTRQKIELKVKEIERLKQCLHELYISKRPRQREDSDISLLHEQIVKLHKGRRHGSDNLVKERQILKKINQAREEVEKMSANSPSEPVTRIYTWRWDILDTKEALTDYIKVTTREVKELRMKQMTFRAYDSRAQLDKAATENEIRILERKLENVKQKKVQVSKLQLKTKIQVEAMAELQSY